MSLLAPLFPPGTSLKSPSDFPARLEEGASSAFSSLVHPVLQPLITTLMLVSLHQTCLCRSVPFCTGDPRTGQSASAGDLKIVSRGGQVPSLSPLAQLRGCWPCCWRTLLNPLQLLVHHICVLQSCVLDSQSPACIIARNDCPRAKTWQNFLRCPSAHFPAWLSPLEYQPPAFHLLQTVCYQA